MPQDIRTPVLSASPCPHAGLSEGLPGLFLACLARLSVGLSRLSCPMGRSDNTRASPAGGVGGRPSCARARAHARTYARKTARTMRSSAIVAFSSLVITSRRVSSAVVVVLAMITARAPARPRIGLATR